MSSTLSRRIAAAAVLSVTAASGVALTGGVAVAHAPRLSHTSLSIRAVKAAINPGGGDVVRGQLQSAGGQTAGRRIELRAHVQGVAGWSNVKHHRTRANGQVAFEVVPTGTTRYQLAFAGNAQQAASHSGIVTVRVLDRTSLVETVGTKSIEPGGSDAVNGVLSLDGTPIAGGTVDLVGAPIGNHLAYIASAISGADGSVTFPVTPSASSHYALVFKKTTTDPGARSAESVIRVRMPSSLSIRARSNQKQATELISGQLRGSGKGLAHRKVTLQSRPSGTSVWTTVTSKFTRRHGVVGFKTAAPTVSTDYQLGFRGGPVYDGCASGVVTVTVA